MSDQHIPDDGRFRAILEEMINPNDPRLQAAVVSVLRDHLADVFTHVGTELEKAGFTEAAQFVRTNFSE